MGLDAIEIVLAVEDEFQIAVTDEEANNSETPAQLTEIIYSKLRQSNDDICLSQHGFYTVRKILMRQLDISRNIIKPDTLLSQLLDIKQRLKYWDKILSQLSRGQTIRVNLERPKWLKITIYFVMPLIVFPIFFYLTYFSIPLTVLAVGALIFILTLFTKSMKYEFPSNFMYVKDLIKIVGTLQTKVWGKDEVYKKVRKIVAAQLNIKENDILPDSHFVKDLGVS